MARSAGKVLSKAFQDDDWRSLPPRPQWLYWLLLGQSKLTLIGCMDYMPARWATLAATIDPAYIEATIAMLEETDYLAVDRTTGEVLIRTFVKHDGISTANVNIRKGCWSAWEAIASPMLRKVAVDNMPGTMFDLAPPEALQMSRSEPMERASDRAFRQATEQAMEGPSEPPTELTCIPSPSPETTSVAGSNERLADFTANPAPKLDLIQQAEQPLEQLFDVYATLTHHLPLALGDTVLCMCGQRFDGPAYQRLHLAALLVAGQMCCDDCTHPSHAPLPKEHP